MRACLPLCRAVLTHLRAPRAAPCPPDHGNTQCLSVVFLREFCMRPCEHAWPHGHHPKCRCGRTEHVDGPQAGTVGLTWSRELRKLPPALTAPRPCRALAHPHRGPKGLRDTTHTHMWERWAPTTSVAVLALQKLGMKARSLLIRDCKFSIARVAADETHTARSMVMIHHTQPPTDRCEAGFTFGLLEIDVVIPLLKHIHARDLDALSQPASESRKHQFARRFAFLQVPQPHLVCSLKILQRILSPSFVFPKLCF